MTCLRILLPTITASLILGAPATAAPPAPAEQSSPFLGAWELELTRMPDSYGPPPKHVLYTFKDAGAGKWTTTIAITAPDNSVRNIAIHYRRDGKAVTSEGDKVDGDTAAINTPAPNVLVMSIAQNKHLGSVRVYTVSPDGKEMTEAAANVDPTGAPFVRNFHFKRVG